MASFTKWDAIKAFYESHHKQIAACQSEWGVIPYSWDGHGVHMTPIEAMIWGDIRSIGAVLYPQYPACGFFVDFGNPVAKVAIECDGKEFHKDKAKDAARDLVLRNHGWSVYRFTGAECFQDTEESEDENGLLVVNVSETFRRLSEIAKNHQIIVGLNRRAD